MRKTDPRRAASRPSQALVFARADPAQLAAFDPSTKACTMNCGPHRDDPRSARERQFLCDECHVYSAADRLAQAAHAADLVQHAARLHGRSKPLRMVDADGRVWIWTGEIST